MTPSLRAYQQEDLKKLLSHNCTACFNEQRTGKTPTAINVALARKVNRCVVVCPASAQYPWRDEWIRWASQPAIVLTGPITQRMKKLKDWESGAVIISYDCLKTTSKHTGMLDAIMQYKPEMIIADEAHRFKTPGTAIAKAMFKTFNIPYRLALTGTPAPNKPQEVWSILHWLYPNYYKSYYTFLKENFYTFEMQGKYGNRFTNVGHWKPGRRVFILKEIESISTQRKRKDVMSWLPAKDYTDIRLDCTKEQIKYLEELKEFYETEHVITQGTLDNLVRLRQVCLAPELLNLKSRSPKMDWILTYLSDYPEVPTIIFTKFTSFIHLLADKLEKNKTRFGVIEGKTSASVRADNIKAFQTGKINLLLINIDAGKEALTLDRGECIIFAEQYPPASDIQQAEDRFVATTEDKADKPHRIIRLMMKDTYDEELYNLVQDRVSATDVINNYKIYLKGV